VLGNLVCLPLLEAESEPLMAVVLVVRLILMIFNSYEVAVNSLGVEGKRDKRIDGCCLGQDLECP
jgi:hypothetical protein